MPMNKSSGQKLLARNRTPRVQIEYDVEIYGAQRKIQLPFVMGALADLAGRAGEELPAVDQRQFAEVDSDNFDDYMKSLNPRAVFQANNTLTGEGKLHIDLRFNSMKDFSPDAVARNVAPLRQLLQARTQLANLLTYMDGKNGAEQLVSHILQNEELLRALNNAPALEHAGNSACNEGASHE